MRMICGWERACRERGPRDLISQASQEGPTRQSCGFERAQTHIEQTDGGRDVVLVVLDGLLSRLADGLEGRDVDHAPDARPFLVVEVKDALDIGRALEVAVEHLDLGVGLVLLARAAAELVARNLRDAVEGLGERVGEAGAFGGRVSTRGRGQQRQMEGAPHRRWLTEYPRLDDGDSELVGEEQAEHNVRACRARAGRRDTAQFSSNRQGLPVTLEARSPM